MRWTAPAVLLLPSLLLLGLAADVVRGWRGAACCREALVPGCRAACRRAATGADLRRSCRQSHEAELFRCLKHRKRGKNSIADPETEDGGVTNVAGCCRQAETAGCRAACLSLRQEPPADQAELRRRLQAGPCTEDDSSFWTCYTADGGDGTASAAVPSAPKHQLELQCCHLASSDECRRLCFDTYSSGWHHQGPRLERQCLSRQYGEPELRRCIRDAEAPCQPNSGRLQFCGAFIEGSTGLYRRWDEQADDRAKTQYINWVRRGMLDVPFPNRSILTTRPCRTELRRLACFIHLEPCHRGRHNQAQICGPDCRRLSELCLDPAAGLTDIDAVCALLSGPEDDCVRLPPPKSPSQPVRTPEVSSPCLPSPCGSGRTCRAGHPNQSPYTCRPGCRLSTVSPRMAEEGASVLLPSLEPGRLSLLTCAPGGALVECGRIQVPQPLPCDLFGSKIGSGEVVRQDCQICVCVDGEAVCRSTEECSKSTRSAPAQPPPPQSCDGRDTRCLAEVSEGHDPCGDWPCRPGFQCRREPQLYVDSLLPSLHHTCVPHSAQAVSSLVADCLRSEPTLTLPELHSWQPQSDQDCERADTPCSPSNISCSSTAPQCGRKLKLYFSGRRLAALRSPVPVQTVLAALQRLVATAECRVRGRLDEVRQMTVTVSPTSDSEAVRRACQLEVDKLRAWLVTDSPVVTAEPSLWPVMYAELAHDSKASSAASNRRIRATAAVLGLCVILLL